jgi:predicted sugar kinase
VFRISYDALMEVSFSPDADQTDAWTFKTLEEAQATESTFQQAVQMVQSGYAIEQVLAGVNLPENLKQKLKKRLQEAVQQQEVREHQMAEQTREVAAEKTSKVSKFFSMSMIASVISKNALEKIQKLFAQNPNVAQLAKEQGRVLVRSGAMPDLDFKAGQSISAPTVGVGLGKDKQQQR